MIEMKNMQRSNEGRVLTEVILEAFKLNGLLVSAGDRLGKDLGVTSARWKVLGALSDEASGLSVSEIAKKMGQSRQAVQRLANEMVEDGLLDTQVNPKHERAKLHLLTKKGAATLEGIMTKQAPWVNALAGDMSLSDLQSTLRVLKHLSQQLDG